MLNVRVDLREGWRLKKQAPHPRLVTQPLAYPFQMSMNEMGGLTKKVKIVCPKTNLQLFFGTKKNTSICCTYLIGIRDSQ